MSLDEHCTDLNIGDGRHARQRGPSHEHRNALIGRDAAWSNAMPPGRYYLPDERATSRAWLDAGSRRSSLLRLQHEDLPRYARPTVQGALLAPRRSNRRSGPTVFLISSTAFATATITSFAADASIDGRPHLRLLHNGLPVEPPFPLEF